MKDIVIKLWNKAKNSSEPVKASFWFTVCSIINKCIQFITIPIFTRTMTTAEYGEYTTFVSWHGIFIIFATLSIYVNVINNGMLKYKENRATFVSAMQGLTTTISLIFLAVMMCFQKQITSLTDLSPTILVLTVTEIIILQGFEFWAAGERFDYKYKKVILITILIAVLNPLVGLGMVLLAEHKGTARIVSVLVVPIAVYFYLYVRNYIKGKKFFVKEYWKYALILALPLLPHYLSQMLLNQMDHLMIKEMCGKEEAAIYGVAFSVAMVPQIIGKAIQGVMTPWIYTNVKQNQTAPVKDTVNKLCVLIAGINFFVICFAPEIIPIFGGKEYTDAIFVIPPIAVSCFLIFLYGMFSVLEFYYEHTKAMMVISVFGAVLNFVLNYIFIPLCGYKAAGYTTLVSFLFFVVVHYFVMKKVVKKNGHEKGIYDGRFLLLFSMAFVLVGIGMTVTYGYPIVRYGVLLLVFLVVVVKRKELIGLLKKYIH